MSIPLYTCTSADDIRLRVDRIAGSLAIAIVDGPDSAAAIALTMEQEAELLLALSPDLRERVRRVMADIDELRDGPLQRELRLMLKAHVSSAPGAQLEVV